MCFLPNGIPSFAIHDSLMQVCQANGQLMLGCWWLLVNIVFAHDERVEATSIGFLGIFLAFGGGRTSLAYFFQPQTSLLLSQFHDLFNYAIDQ